MMGEASPARVKPIIDPAANWGKYPIITGTPSGGDSFIWLALGQPTLHWHGWPLVNYILLYVGGMVGPFIGMVGPWSAFACTGCCAV